jgi:hypothetical protein
VLCLRFYRMPGLRQKSIQDRFARRQYRVIRGPIRRSTLGCAASPMGEEADPEQCWVPAEVVCLPQTTGTPRNAPHYAYFQMAL